MDGRALGMNDDARVSMEETLAQLALDLSLTPNHSASELWRQLNPGLWEQTQNPWVVWQTVSGAHLEKITSDPAFRATLNDVVSARSTESNATLWVHEK